MEDLVSIGIPIFFELIIKDYSKSMYGCYRPDTNRVYLYNFEDKDLTTPYSYEHLLRIAVHESVHAIQWNDPDFVRVKGVMHDDEFHKMFDYYMGIAKEVVFNESCEEAVAKDDSIFVQPIKGFAVPNNFNRPSRTSSGVLRVACRR